MILAACIPLASIAQDDAPADEEDKPTASAYTDYVEMKPSFVTHVGEPSEKLKYLKADVTLRVDTETAAGAIKTHMPRLRHELVMLLGEQTDLETLSSSDGQQALREQARERMNQVLTDQQTGETIVDVLFTTFVIQR